MCCQEKKQNNMFQIVMNKISESRTRIMWVTLYKLNKNLKTKTMDSSEKKQDLEI